MAQETMEEFDPRKPAPAAQEPEMSLMHRPSMMVGELAGERTSEDVSFPWLNIAYGVGGLAQKGFNPGDVVLDDEYLLAKSGDPVLFIPVKSFLFWKEYLTQDMWAAGQTPKVFATLDEVKAAGGTTEWANGQGPTYSRAMDLRLLVQKPEGLVCGMFGLDLQGKVYAPARWSLDKTAFKRAGGPIIQAHDYALAKTGGMIGGTFEVRTHRSKTASGNTTVIPVTRLVQTNSPELVAEIRERFA
jgi:hypothetical protein